MNTKDKKQTAPRRVSKFNREEVSPGVWQYNDPDEEAFITGVMHLLDISAVDDLLDGIVCALFTDKHGKAAAGAPVILSDAIIEALLERRQDAFDAFKAGSDELMEARLDALSGWCHFVGFRAAAQPDIEARVKRRKETREAREGKLATHEDRLINSNRDDRVRKHHAGLLKDGALDATSQTATEFGVSISTVQRALRKGKAGK